MHDTYGLYLAAHSQCSFVMHIDTDTFGKTLHTKTYVRLYIGTVFRSFHTTQWIVKSSRHIYTF